MSESGERSANSCALTTSCASENFGLYVIERVRARRGVGFGTPEEQDDRSDQVETFDRAVRD